MVANLVQGVPFFSAMSFHQDDIKWRCDLTVTHLESRAAEQAMKDNYGSHSQPAKITECLRSQKIIILIKVLPGAPWDGSPGWRATGQRRCRWRAGWTGTGRRLWSKCDWRDPSGKGWLCVSRRNYWLSQALTVCSSIKFRVVLICQTVTWPPQIIFCKYNYRYKRTKFAKQSLTPSLYNPSLKKLFEHFGPRTHHQPHHQLKISHLFFKRGFLLNITFDIQVLLSIV